MGFQTILIDYYVIQANMLSLKKRYPFNKPREYQMDINSETVPSSPSAVQMETNIIPTNPGAPVDISKDIAVRE